jgi:hypothetical protein
MRRTLGRESNEMIKKGKSFRNKELHNYTVHEMLFG